MKVGQAIADFLDKRSAAHPLHRKMAAALLFAIDRLQQYCFCSPNQTDGKKCSVCEQIAIIDQSFDGYEDI